MPGEEQDSHVRSNLMEPVLDDDDLDDGAGPAPPPPPPPLHGEFIGFVRVTRAGNLTPFNIELINSIDVPRQTLATTWQGQPRADLQVNVHAMDLRVQIETFPPAGTNGNAVGVIGAATPIEVAAAATIAPAARLPNGQILFQIGGNRTAHFNLAGTGNAPTLVFQGFTLPGAPAPGAPAPAPAPAPAHPPAAAGAGGAGH